MRNIRGYHTGRLRYQPRRRVVVRKNRFSKRLRAFVFLCLTVCFLTCSFYTVTTACAQNREQCRRQSAMQLGQAVSQYPRGLVCNLTVKCSDNGDNIDTFVCDIVPSSSAEEIGNQINYS